MVALGTGHLVLAALIASEDIAHWVDQGLWAAVPLAPADVGTDRAADTLQNEAAFWGGPGSFAVPLVLLGCLIWHLARRGIAVPAGIGWGLAAWSLVCGILLVPSPYFVLVVSGALIILAARKDRSSR